jgi:hypothetical protein
MRRTKVVTIDGEGRDKGKSYLIVEMPALKSEHWGRKALLAIAAGAAPHMPASDVDVASLGLAGIASLGIKAFGGLDPTVVDPLMDEMFKCISFVPSIALKDPKIPDRPMTRPLIEDDIEEVATVLELRREVLSVHLDFMAFVARLKEAQSSLKAQASVESDIQTSRTT